MTSFEIPPPESPQSSTMPPLEKEGSAAAPSPHPEKSRGPRRVLAFALLGVAALLTVGILPRLERHAELKEAQAAQSAPRKITFSVSVRGKEQGRLVLPGTAAPLETASIYARTNGFVREFKVDIGDRVEAGQLLAVLDTPETEADARSARARADESARNAQIIHHTAERFRRLAAEGVSSRQEAEDAEARANSAEAALDTSRAELERWNTLLDFRYVRAPFAGVVTRRNVEKGALVTAGSGAGLTSLYEIARTEKLRIQVEVPQSLAASIRIGEAAAVQSGGLEVEGVVARTSGALDPKTRTLRAEIHIPGDRGILAGSFVRVTLRTHAASPPTLVPAGSVVARPAGNAVFVLDANDTVREAPVALGRELGTTVEILSGLASGERVVTNPPENLTSGEVVRPLERPFPADPTEAAPPPSSPPQVTPPAPGEEPSAAPSAPPGAEPPSSEPPSSVNN